jgi:ADYC domain
MRPRQGFCFLLALLLAVGFGSGPSGGTAAAAGREVAVVGTEFRITLEDDRVLTGRDLLGIELDTEDAEGRTLTIRIDGIEPDPLDPTGETVLYALSASAPNAGGWKTLCDPGPDGLRMGFPLAGTWTATGEHVAEPGSFGITCTAGAIGKCVRFGYKPWATGPDGLSLWDVHQACVRMVRADYCGDGQGHTRTGTRIDLYDRLGIQRDEPAPGMSFEAAWAPDGAVCVAHPRLPDLITLEEVARSCPARLAGRTGPACSEDGAGKASKVLLFNKS